MKNYLAGCDILGADWGVPVVMDEADIGIPSFVDDVTGDVVEDTEAVVERDIKRMEKELSDEFEREFDQEEEAIFSVVGRGGGGGHGGGHGGGGHGHGGRGRGGRGWGGRGWGGYGGWGGAYPYYVDTVDCEYDQFGNCIPVTPLLVVGMEDIGKRQAEMNRLKNVPVAIAQVLLKYGQQAINKAIEGAKQPFYKFNLPGENARANVQGKLQWHANAISQLLSTPDAMYASGDDLKKYVMQAFIEQNSVEEGANDPTWSKAWGDWANMWEEVGRVLAKLPKAVAKAVGDLAGDIVKGVTGVPIWGWAIIGAGVLGALGFLIYKLADTKAGAAVAGRLPL